MKSSSGIISIAASAPKLDVDNRISLRNYYRIANNLIKQADIYREENNVIDLYVMLLRFSSLITETIPCHRDYQVSLQGERSLFKKKLLHVMCELEELKPEVQRCLEDLNRKSRSQVTRWSENYQSTSNKNTMESPVRKQVFKSNSKQLYQVRQNGVSRFPFSQQDVLPQLKRTGEQFQNLSLTTMWPKEETLSRHSILGPNGLSGYWQPIISQQVQYPSNIDLSPIQIPSLCGTKLDDPVMKNTDVSYQDNTNTILEEVLSLNDGGASLHVEEPPSSMISFDGVEFPAKMELIRDPSPPPVHAEVIQIVTATSPQSNSTEQISLSKNEMVGSESALEVHISSSLMESFLRVAKSNTDRHIETCGVIAGLLKNRKFFVTALIIPKQEGTSDSCQTTNEEEIFDYQDKHSLFPLGWIHTHPTQSCFMSSIDVHTHYSYQVMLPEAIAIVMAPGDVSSKHGIFRLTTPGGMSVIRKCDQRGFHPHPSPQEGGPIYDHCSDVFINPSLKIDVVDLR